MNEIPEVSGERIGNGRLIFRAITGSRAYGLDTPESDVDTRGVCIPEARFVLGLGTFEQWESEGSDHVIFGLSKFLRLALQGNPNIIELLFTPDDCVLFVDPELGQPLIDARDLLLSRRVGERFMNYALHQLKRIERHYRWLINPITTEPSPADFGASTLEGKAIFPSIGRERDFKAAQKAWSHYRTWREERHPDRAALEEKYGYDTKHASHLCRLLNMGTEILESGQVLVRRPDHEFLRGVRTGALGYEELLEWANQRVSALPELVAGSSLPEDPAESDVEDLMIELNRRALGI